MNWILEYYQAIVSGTVVVGTWVRRLYAMIVADLEAKAYRYNARKAGRAIRFIEQFCRHHEGALAPQRITLELWQKAFIACLFGLVDADGTRHFREVVLIIGRKNGKTLLAAAIAACMAYVDGEYGARVYFCAPKLDQARLCFEAFCQMVAKEPELSGMARKRRTDIYIAESNSSAQPLAFSAKKSDGLNPHLTVCDEIAAWAGDAGLKQYEVLKSALGARRQPVLLSISTAGYVEDGIFDELIRRGTAVLNGDSRERRLLPVLYMIDDPEKWSDINELRKANPNLGVSVSVDYMLEEIAVAETSLSKRGEFLTKYCNIKQNTTAAWFAVEDVNRCCGEPLRLEDFHRTYGVVGVDLSRTTDLTCAGVLIERGGVLNWLCHFWLPEERVAEAVEEDNIPYRAYVQRGLLSLCPGHEIDYREVEEWILDLLKVWKIYVLRVGYDRYSATYLVQDLEAAGLKCDSVFQGENLTGIINQTEAAVKDGLIRIGDNDLMKMHLLDSAVKVNNDTDRKKLVKLRKRAHIDGMAALLDAMCMRSVYHSELGRRLENRPREGS